MAKLSFKVEGGRIIPTVSGEPIEGVIASVVDDTQGEPVKLTIQVIIDHAEQATNPQAPRFKA